MFHYEKGIGLTDDYFFWKKDDADDERTPIWKEQREKYGFDERELWDLHTVIAAFVYPRLKMFAEYTASVPMGMKPLEWRNILEKMVRAFELIITDQVEAHHAEVTEGLDLFREYYFDLWD
jgi:hypothetical protein